MALFATQYRELLAQTPGLAEEFDDFYPALRAFLLEQHNEDGTHITDDPTSGVASADVAYVTIGNTSDLSNERALTGTANEIDVTDNGAGSTVAIGLVADVTIGTSLTVPTATVTTAAITTGTTTTAIATTDGIGAAAAASSLRRLTKKVTGIADNTATDVLTVTVPNANHAATIRLLFLSSNGSTDAFESSRTAQGLVVLARTTGLNVVATAAALADAAIATVSGGATHTLAYGLSTITGAVGATNTFTIRVTIDDSGNTGSNQVVVYAELFNAEATGVTIA